MPSMQLGAAVPDAEIAHLALDASRVEVAAAADAPATGDFGEQRRAPRWQALRIEAAVPGRLRHQLADREVFHGPRKLAAHDAAGKAATTVRSCCSRRMSGRLPLRNGTQAEPGSVLGTQNSRLWPGR